MAKIIYNDITFDSQLEIDYYKYLQDLILKGEVITFIYHPTQIQNLIGKRSYTPDFLVLYADNHFEIVETKGYNPYSKNIDDQIHNVMLTKDERFLKAYVLENGFSVHYNEKVIYKKIKYMKQFGWVDFNFKNPNTKIKQARTKISDLKGEIATYKRLIKDYDRYFTYEIKVANNGKLTKQQKDWLETFKEQNIERLKK